ncbi:hypothetical protein [Methanothermococcus thermolithotrophicus]|uniref:hypothetical protein n=1 Tax=Methanothermococcus thermolithotrophicus TaxID=2186 RepID=UPI0003750566|nr:hypothetical protein [Methanothermococcus thermolithotrophicus]
MGSINAVITDASNVNNLTRIITTTTGKIEHNINNSFKILGVLFSGFQSESPAVVSVRPDDFDFINMYVFKGVSGAMGLKSPVFNQKIIIETSGTIEAPIYCTIIYEILRGDTNG